MAGRLEGKVALITGAARGQGAAEARLSAAEGARVVLTDVLDAEVEHVAAEIGSAAHWCRHDITSESDWAAVIAATVEAFGQLDILVNNAGITRMTPIDTTSADQFMDVVRVNQLGTFLGIRAGSGVMGPGGSIINVSSVCGLRGGAGNIAYTSTKFAICGMTKTAAFELAGKGIRVNSVHPGYVKTPMLEDALQVVPERAREKVVAAAALRVPIGAFSEPEDVANLVLFLASDESRHCTGAEFVVDGGLTAGMSFLP